MFINDTGIPAEALLQVIKDIYESGKIIDLLKNKEEPMFKNETEFAVAMAEGRVFKDPCNDKFYMQRDGARRRFVVEFSHGKICELEGLWRSYNKVTEILPWENNIPKRGIPCWVWDDNPSKKQLDIIEGYDYESSELPYLGIAECWKNAQRLTPEELAKMLK